MTITSPPTSARCQPGSEVTRGLHAAAERGTHPEHVLVAGSPSVPSTIRSARRRPAAACRPPAARRGRGGEQAAVGEEAARVEAVVGQLAADQHPPVRQMPRGAGHRLDPARVGQFGVHLRLAGARVDRQHQPVLLHPAQHGDQRAPPSSARRPRTGRSPGPSARRPSRRPGRAGAGWSAFARRCRVGDRSGSAGGVVQVHAQPASSTRAASRICPSGDHHQPRSRPNSSAATDSGTPQQMPRSSSPASRVAVGADDPQLTGRRGRSRTPAGPVGSGRASRAGPATATSTTSPATRSARNSRPPRANAATRASRSTAYEPMPPASRSRSRRARSPAAAAAPRRCRRAAAPDRRRAARRRSPRRRTRGRRPGPRARPSAGRPPGRRRRRPSPRGARRSGSDRCERRVRGSPPSRSGRWPRRVADRWTGPDRFGRARG